MKTIENIRFEIKHVRGPLARRHDDWKQTADQWFVTFYPDNGPFFTVDYYRGIGHRKLKTKFGLSQDFNPETVSRIVHDPTLIIQKSGLDTFLRLTKAEPPPLKDVLYSLWADSNVENENFNKWCANYGYSDDSISALNMYKLCLENARKFRTLNLSKSYLDNLFSEY